MWKKYKDYNIEVNEKGETRNAKTKKPRKQVALKGRKENWYKVICINVNKKPKTLYVHRIIAETFIPNPNNYPCVNHIDNNKQNNSVDNLEWCTFKENTQNAFYKQNAFKKYVCVCCGKEVFELKENNSVCSDCKYKQKIQENRAKKLKERQQLIQNVKNCNGYINFYYIKHQEVFDNWANGKTCNKLSEELNCTHQNINKLISNLKNLYNSYNLQTI